MSGEPIKKQALESPPVREETEALDPTGLSGEELILPADSEIDPTLSFVMPTLNEEDGVGQCIEMIRNAVEDLGVFAEVIISDSSTDRTPDIARSMGAIVVTPDGPGYGYAYQYAFDRCRGEYIAIGDADTTYDFEELPGLFNLVANGDADMAMGSRLEGEIKDGAMPPLHQYIGNPLLTRFLNAFYDAGVSDAHSGMRVFTREAWETMDCDTDGMEFASEMIMEAGARGLTIEERPIVYHEREGEATLESFEDGWRHVRFMLLNAPGYLFSVPGVVVGLVGAVLMAIAATGVSPNGATFGVRTLLAGSLFVITGVQVASLGIYATIATDPIRRPRDPVTELVTKNLTLESGVLTGVILFGLSATYGTWMIIRWILTGYQTVPAVPASLVAFTGIVVGIQVVFGSFFVGTLSDR